MNVCGNDRVPVQLLETDPGLLEIKFLCLHVGR